MPSIHKDHLVTLAEAKAQDALLLLQHGRYSNAYHLAGYAIEIGLKAVIAAEFQSSTLPDKNFVSKIYIHEIEKLIGFAGLQGELEERRQADIRFAANWAVVANWSEGSRYEAVDATAATALIDAILEDNSGVLVWLRTHW